VALVTIVVCRQPTAVCVPSTQCTGASLCCSVHFCTRTTAAQVAA
jgi:hypothetical protein